MENTENKPILTSPAGSNENLAEQVDALRHLVISMLVLVVIFTGAFNIYLWRQVKYLRQELSTVRPQATALVTEFQKTGQAQLNDFLQKCIEYGKAHPQDQTYAALMKKFHLDTLQFTNAPAAAPVAPAASTATGAAPKKK